MERKLRGKIFQKVGYNSRGCPPFWKFWKMLFLSLLEVAENSNQVPVVQKVDNAIHRINHYLLDSAMGFPNTYPWVSDLSVG